MGIETAAAAWRGGARAMASLLIKLAELHIYEEARKGPTLLLSSASAYEEELSKNDVVHSFITKL